MLHHLLVQRELFSFKDLSNRHVEFCRFRRAITRHSDCGENFKIYLAKLEV